MTYYILSKTTCRLPLPVLVTSDVRYWIAASSCLIRPCVFSLIHCSLTNMDNSSPDYLPKKKRTTTGGVHCIVPGCTNSFYNASGKHYHKLPLKNASLLKRWLQNIKRANSPVNDFSRVCSDHFCEEDYVQKGSFDDEGRHMFVKTSRLKETAMPSIFNFSGYSTGQTDHPSFCPPAATAWSIRLKNRVKQKEVSKCILYLTS